MSLTESDTVAASIRGANRCKLMGTIECEIVLCPRTWEELGYYIMEGVTGKPTSTFY
jgi:hypothetical protein